MDKTKDPPVTKTADPKPKSADPKYIRGTADPTVKK